MTRGGPPAPTDRGPRVTSRKRPRPKIVPKSMLFFDRFWCRFWCGLGSLLGSILDPFGHPSWPEFGPSRLLKLHFLQKVDFQKNERHPAWEHDFDPKTAPKTTQDRPKTAPRRSSGGTFFMFDFVFDFGAFLVRFWSNFGTPNRSFWGSFFTLFSDVAPGAPQERPKRRQEAPKGIPGGTKRPPRGPKSAQKGPQEAPRGPKRSQKARGREKRSVQNGSQNTIFSKT